jgi:hypothetical protein
MTASEMRRASSRDYAELEAFFRRNPHLVGWRERVRVIALCQGGAEH